MVASPAAWEASNVQVSSLRVSGSGGLALHVHRFTDESATPRGVMVLCLHGFLDGGATWDRVAGPLAANGYEVIAPDLRGFGGSERVGVGGYYHFPDYVADVDALVRTLAPSRLVVVGHSMGGTVACLYAGARPQSLERLVVIEGVGPPSMPPDQAKYRMRQWLVDLERQRTPRPLASLDDAVRRLAMNHPNLSRDVLEVRARQLTVTLDEGLAWAHDPLHRTTSPIGFSADVLQGYLSEFRSPVLFVSGGENGFHPEDEAERLAAFEDVRRVELPSAGHMVHWTEPEALAREIASFIG